MDINKKILIGVVSIIVLVLGYILFNNQSSNRAVLTAPAADATSEEQAEYVVSVKRLAEAAAVLEIGEGCTMTPLVLKLAEGETLTIQNNDATAHTIAFEDQNFFSVSPGRSREIDLMAIFGKGEGIYRYRCSDVDRENNVGVLYIVE